METVTVFKEDYNKLLDREFELLTQFATLKGKIRAYSKIIETDPQWVESQLKSLVEDFEKGVDISFD